MVCNVCGFNYNTENCPVCVTESKNAEAARKHNGLGIAGMVLGIIGFSLFVISAPIFSLAFCISGYIGAILAIPQYAINLAISAIGLFFSIFAKIKCGKNSTVTVGKILSWIGLISNFLAIVVYALLLLTIFVLLFFISILAYSF